METVFSKKYWAFISYSSKDKKWGQWLHKQLERYPIPKELQGVKLFDDAVLGKNLRPVFRDRDELSGSAELGAELEKALRDSRYLVVLCSKHSASSKWVDKEIEDFKSLGGENNILALILDGEPNSGGADECFPPSLRYPTEPLAGDLRKDGDGKERGLLKIVAGIAQLDFDALYRRHERAQQKRRLAYGSLAFAVIAALAGLSLFAFQQRSEAQANALTATEMQAFAEANERRATGLLVSSYVERGRQSFIDGANAESLAMFNEARKINPRVTGINWMMADIWKQLSPLQEEISGEREAISQLFFSNDGTTLVAQDTHGRIRRFELGPDPANLTMASHQFISAMQHPMIFSSTPHLIGYFEQTNPENPNFLSREIRRVNWHTGSEVDSIAWGKDQRKPDLIVASPGGSRLATYTDADGEQPRRIVRLWKFASDATIESQIELPESPGNFHWFFSADEQTLIQLRYSGSTFDITFRNSSTGKILQHFPLNSRPEAHATYKNRICIGLYNGEIIEFQRDQEISQRSPSDKIVTQLGTLQYSSDGKQLLAGGTLGEVGLYRCEDFSVTMKLDREQIDGVVKHVALSDQGHFISVAHKNSVSIFEAHTSKRFGHFSWAGSEASSCTFSNDEKQLAVGTESGNIRIWSVEKQSAWHQEYQPVGERSLVDFSHVEGSQYIVRGGETHVLDVSTGAISQLSYQKRPVDGISPNRKLLLLGSGLDGLAIANANTGKFLETPWDIRARNVFLKQESRVAGVIVLTDGALQAYSSVPELLPNSFRSQQALGDPQSVVCQSNHAVVCASFADGSILEFSTTDEGIQNPLLHRLDGTKKAAPDLLELSNNLLLVSRQGRLAIYDLKTKSLIELPRRGLRGGKFVTYQDQLSVLTVDSFGQLEAWSDQGQLLANASLPIQKDSGNPLLRPKHAGVSILVSRNADTAYTTFGNQIYAWSLPDLALSWRSPEIAATSEFLTLRRLSEAEDQIVVTDQSVFKSDQTFTKVHTVSLPTTVPSIDDAGSYLSNVAGINVVAGRVIRN